MKKQIIFLIIALILPAASLQAAISSVTITPAPPTTLSNGFSYYLSGVQYSFRVQAVDLTATDKAYWHYIELYIEEGVTTRQSIIINVDDNSTISNTGFTNINVTDNTSSYTDLDYTITVTFRWDAVWFNAGGNRVRTVVTTDNGTAFVTSTGNNSSTFNFGACSRISVINFAQDGVASDGRINPWHLLFHVTGSIVYYVTDGAGSGPGDTVHTKATAGVNEITGTSLLLDPAPTGPPLTTAAADADESNGLDYTINAAYFNTTFGPWPAGLGNYQWSVRVNVSTAPAGTIDSVNTLSINVDTVQVTNIQFINGGGINSPYYRSVNVPGTQVQVTAQMQNGGGTMIGNTTVTVRNVTDGTNFDMQILSGQNVGIGNVTSPVAGDVPNGTTQQTTYRIERMYGNAYDGSTTDGQYLDTRITQPANPVIYWDRNDPPGDNNAPGVGETPFTGGIGVSPTSGGFALTWTALNPSSPIPPFDGDFYTYRIYYKLASSSTWTIVDRSTLGYGPGGTYRLDLIGTSSAQITGLQPLTNYNYFITAVDVFGQEVEYTAGTSDAAYAGAPLGDYGTVLTAATSISVKITDGVTEYPDSTHQFEIAGPINAINRPLRKSSLRVTLFIVATSQPDSVNVILARDDGFGNGIPAGDLVTITNVLVSQAIINWERISCSKSAPNTWQCYIPSNNQFLVEGQFCRFIIESIKGGIPTYSDALLEASPPGEANTYEFTFMVQTPTTFHPWPTRVLNNVITEKNPVCYPSYYLSADAYVTIKVYDIKGRPVATLIDNGFRKGGQNIKEGGWAGDNKARRKLGVGLYYLRFEAKRASDGKVILNQTEKVVVAK